jgi:TolB protein
MNKRLVAFCACMLALVAAMPAHAQIILGGKPVTVAPAAEAPAARTFPVDADRADYKPLVIATHAFAGATDEEKQLAAKVSDAMRHDLASVGIFAGPEEASVAALAESIDALPKWADWSGAGVDILVLGRVAIIAGNQLNVQFRVYDIASRKELIATSFTTASPTLWDRTAHVSADAIMQKLAGGEAGFNSRIAYVAEAQGKTQLAFINADGGWAETVDAPVMNLEAPSQSRASQVVIYAALAPLPGKPSQSQRTAIMYDLSMGRRESLIDGVQPNADARFAGANDRHVIFSRKTGANTDIYLFALATRKETRLTDDPAADTEPSMSPDGTLFTFVSDRGGAAQIYAARVDGAAMTCADGAQAKACRLTSEGGNHGAPAWSPRGDWIAFTRKTGEETAIHIVRPDGSGARALTDPGAGMLDLSPTWSPEGRRIAFSRMTGDKAHLAVVPLTGGEPRKVETGGNAFDPDWGPPQR